MTTPQNETEAAIRPSDSAAGAGCERLCGDFCNKYEESQAKIRILRDALRLLMKEVDASGNGDARDFGWAEAVDAARSALDA